jgi:eukaryotic-like serine/threonine-protein kinase
MPQMTDPTFPLVYNNFWNHPIHKVPVRITGSDDSVYDLEEILGSGGNGVVARAVDHRSGDSVAIKFLLNASSSGTQRFDREIEFLKTNAHPAIVGLLDQGTTRARKFRRSGGSERPLGEIEIPFFVMPMADENLLQYLRKRNWALQPYEYLGNLTSLADGLASAHSIGFHRDLKPENILVFGEAWKIADFGLCYMDDASTAHEATQPGVPLGPKYWMSPEAIESFLKIQRLEDRCSDVFQLGAIFWIVINGHHPTGVVTEDDWVGPSNLFGPVWKALQWKKTRRFANGGEFSEALKAAVDMA